MKEASIVSRLRSALNQRFDTVAKEPLPERWVDLINELNERERRDEELLRDYDPGKTRHHAKCLRPISRSWRCHNFHRLCHRGDLRERLGAAQTRTTTFMQRLQRSRVGARYEPSSRLSLGWRRLAVSARGGRSRRRQSGRANCRAPPAVASGHCLGGNGPQGAMKQNSARVSG